MKPLLLCSLLLGVSVVVQAQAPVGSRALKRGEIAAKLWPTASRAGGELYDYQIRALQLLLRNSGFGRSRPDGVFGSVTQTSVRSFQRAKKLKADGVVGAQTWEKLCPRLKRGDRGDGVRALQTLLNGETNQDGDPIFRRKTRFASFSVTLA